MVTIKLKTDGSSSYEEIDKKIDLLKERFTLGYNSVPTMDVELSKIDKYVEEGISLTNNEKENLKSKINNLKKDLPILNRERNLPYNKSINAIKLLEEDFLEDSFWRPTPEELEQSYIRVLNILRNNDELTNKEKAMLKEFVSQKISEIPTLTERRDKEEKKHKAEKKVAIENAKERYKKQSFFTKLKQTLSKETPKQMKDDFDFMSVDSIDELYKGKSK